jgi:hypothetical protein
MKIRNLLKNIIYCVSIFLVMLSIAEANMPLEEPTLPEKNVYNQNNVSLRGCPPINSFSGIAPEPFKIIASYLFNRKDLGCLRIVFGKNKIKTQIISDRLQEIVSTTRYNRDLTFSQKAYVNFSQKLRQDPAPIGVDLVLRNIKESSGQIKLSKVRALTLIEEGYPQKLWEKRTIKKIFSKNESLAHLLKISLKNIELKEKALLVFVGYLDKTPHVNTLEISNCVFKMEQGRESSEVFSHSERISKLQSLTWDQGDIGDEGLQFLKKCSSLTALKLSCFYINYFSRSPGISKKLLLELSFLKDTLIELSLQNMSLKRKQVKVIANFIHLKTLDLSYNKLEDKDIASINNFLLTSLNVSHNRLTTDAFCRLGLMKDLREKGPTLYRRDFLPESQQSLMLNFFHNKEMVHEIYEHCPLFTTTLIDLDISNNRFYYDDRFFDKDMEFLILFKNLKKLNVSNNEVGTSELSLISGLPLASLNLSYVSVSPLQILTNMQPDLLWEKLTELKVRGYLPTPEEMYLFRKLRNITTLEISLPSKEKDELIFMQCLAELPYLTTLVLEESLRETSTLSSFIKFPSLKTLCFEARDSVIIKEFGNLFLPLVENFYLSIKGEVTHPIVEALKPLVKAEKKLNLGNLVVEGNFKDNKEKISKHLHKKKRSGLNLILVKGGQNFFNFREYF